MSRVSIILTTYNRARLLKTTLASFMYQKFKDYEVIVVDDGTDDQTKRVCENFAEAMNGRASVRYIRNVREPGSHYSNPAIPNNIGIKSAEGEILIIQNAECQHFGEVIQQLTEGVNDKTCVFASVEALTVTGGHADWYVHSQHSARPFFFCGAISRKTAVALGGFDEDYLYYGFEDDCFRDRLALSGVEFVFRDDIIVKHNWHPNSFKVEDAERNQINAELYKEKTLDLKYGRIGIVRNVGREWGVGKIEQKQ